MPSENCSSVTGKLELRASRCPVLVDRRSPGRSHSCWALRASGEQLSESIALNRLTRDVVTLRLAWAVGPFSQPTAARTDRLR